MSINVNLQPTLTGQRIVVRPIEDSDWDAMFSAASDPGIWALHPDSERYKESVFRQFFDDALACNSAFAFVDRESGQIVGSSRYFEHKPVEREIEIGWTFLTRDYWGGSYNAEVKQLMLEHAFTFVDTVIFRVDETNLRSRRAMEKIGGVLRDGIVVRQEMPDRPFVVYEIRKADW